MEKPKIFINYSHKDTEWKDRLVTHLNVLVQEGQIELWTDDEIRIGEKWFEKIQGAMDAASVAIFLVSADSLTSKFILREEIKRLLERRDREGLGLFPVLVGPCVWTKVDWLAQLQIRPKGGVPLSEGTRYESEKRLAAIVEEIADVVERRVAPSIPPLPALPKEEPRIQTFASTPEPTNLSLPPPFSEITNSIGMKLILIPAGEFLMGSEDRKEEKPVRRVQISKPFYLGKYPVTQAQWETVMGNNPSRFKGEPNRPVDTVSWNEAHEFLRKLSAREGRNPYRLPTEAEWEYACRAGSTGAYYFGDNEAMLGEYAWHTKSSFAGLAKAIFAIGGTHSVGQLKPNDWGLYDMLGNVWEWVQDWYAEDYYKQRPNPDSDPQGPEKGERRVMRGGSWGDAARYVRVALRIWLEPGLRSGFIGFRCAQ